MKKKERGITIGMIILILLVLLFFFAFLTKEDNYNFRIHFFNAGKADAIFLEKEGQYIMIDTGEDDLSDDILRYFELNNIEKLDYLIITHFDKDHVGSASVIIDNIEIGEVLQSNVPKDSKEYENYLASLENNNIEPTTVTGDCEISIADLEIVVNGPEKVYDKNESNNSSLIVSVKDGENKFLFMGDSQNARIKEFLSNNDEYYNFLKVPYHGNNLEQNEVLLESNNFAYAVITDSVDEPADDETIKFLNDYGVKYYSTKNGSINVLSDGKTIKIKQ